MDEHGDLILTDDARGRINSYLQEVDAELARSGMPPAEREAIKADIHVQILEMLNARARDNKADKANVEAVISELDPPRKYNGHELDKEKAAAAPSGPTVWPDFLPGQTGRERHTVFIALFGVILPLVTLLIETLTGFCANAFFDPIPTTLHIALVTCVPLTLLAMLVRRESPITAQGVRLWKFFWGFALGVTIWYATGYLILAPLAVFALIIFGLGLLPLTPYLTLWALLRARSILKDWDEQAPTEKRGRPIGWGVTLSIGLLALLAVQGPLCNYLINTAQSRTGSAMIARASWIDRLGLREELERRCESRTARGEMPMLPVMLLGLMPVAEDFARPAVPDACEIHYRLYGKIHNPRNFGSADEFSLLGEDFMIGRSPARFQKASFKYADDTVFSPVPGLSMQASRVEADIHTSASVGYAEWTMTFLNKAMFQREAWGLVELPAGGVVSRVTLWVNGEEREAAFAGSGAVTAAYERVITRRQDPLLVTSAGSDRVILKCFPVPPQGGTMKIRLGITFPLQKSAREGVDWCLPRLSGRNFDLDPQLEPAYWLWADSGPLTGEIQELHGQETGNGFTLTGKATPEAVLKRNLIVVKHVTADAPITVADLREPERWEISQARDCSTSTAAASIVLALDTSRGMQHALPALAQAVSQLPPDCRIAVVTEANCSMGPDFVHGSEAAEFVKTIVCEGGTDNAPVLTKAWQLTQSARTPSMLVWCHAGQGIELSSLEPLRTEVSRGVRHPRFCELQVADGPDVIVTELVKDYPLERIPWKGNLDSTIDQFFAGLSGDSECLMVRHRSERKTSATLAVSDTKTTLSGAGHISRLWAYEEVMRLFRTRNPGQRDDAVRLAARYQLVTPVSGAVVLENQSQYKEAGLQPVDPATVPAVPEPETWILIGVALLIAAVAALRLKLRTPRLPAP